MLDFKNVELIIKNFQGFSHDDMDEIELTVKGMFKKVSNGYIIVYENENKGLTRIILFNRKVKIVNIGENLSYYLQFSEGDFTKAVFKSKCSSLNINIYTSKILIDMAKERKEIILFYDLEIDFENVLKNRLVILVDFLKS